MTKHQNLTSASDTTVFTNSLNKDQQDLPLRRKSNTSEGCSSAVVKSEKVARKVFRLKKKARKHRSVSELNGSEIWVADISVVKQPNKGLAGCWIKGQEMLAVMKTSETTTAT